MHTLIRSARPWDSLRTKAGSARSERAIDMRSAALDDSIRSATSGRFIRLLAVTGIVTAFFKRAVASTNAACGTMPAIIGIGASPADAAAQAIGPGGGNL